MSSSEQIESPNQRKFSMSTKGEIFELLSSHRRRYTLQFCKQADGAVTLSELAEQVAAWEQEKPIEELTSAERKRVYTSLQQTHLDRLEEAGMITRERDEIELTDEAETLDVYLDIVPEESVPWSVYYLGLSFLSLTVLAGLWLDILPTEMIPSLAYATILIVVFVVSATIHYTQSSRYSLDEFEPWD